MLFPVTYKQMAYSRRRHAKCTDGWSALKGRLELSHHLRLHPSGSLRVTWTKCHPLWRGWLIVLSTRLSLYPEIWQPLQHCALFCRTVVLTAVMHWEERERVNENEWGLKREHESKRETERAYYWPLIGHGESTPLFCVACSQPIGCRNNILGLWMKWIVREQDRSSLIHQA